jgi:hypothetical protein
MEDKLPEISKEKQKPLSRIKRMSGRIPAVERAATDGDECADNLDASGGDPRRRQKPFGRDPRRPHPVAHHAPE